MLMASCSRRLNAFKEYDIFRIKQSLQLIVKRLIRNVDRAMHGHDWPRLPHSLKAADRHLQFDLPGRLIFDSPHEAIFSLSHWQKDRESSQNPSRNYDPSKLWSEHGQTPANKPFDHPDSQNIIDLNQIFK
jgi:hypothetical protein